MSLRALLRRLTWISMLPLLVASLYLSVDNIHALQRRNDHDADAAAHNIAAAIDGKLETLIVALQVLAASPLADDGSRVEELYREAQAYHRILGEHVILADLTMQMLFNTRVAFAEPLPKLPRPRGKAAVPVALETGKPAVGDMFPGPIANQPLVAIAVPVVRDGQTRFLLLTVVETRQFGKLLDTLALPPEWAVRIVDGTGETMAVHAPPDFPHAEGSGAGGRRLVVPSALSPWSVLLEVPSETYGKPIVTATVAIGAGIGIAILLGFFAATAVGRRLARAVTTLADASQPSHSLSGITEIEDVRRMLTAAAAARQAAEAKEQESRRHFRATFEQAAVGIAHVAPDGRFLRVNARFCEIVGRSSDELIRRGFQDITHPDDKERDLAQVGRLLAGETDTYTIEKRYLRPDGDIVWANLTVSLVHAEDRSPDYFVSVIEDITGRKTLEAQLRQAQKMEAVGQLTGGLAHDLNNVLSVISMNVELLDGAVRDNFPVAPHVEAALKGVQRASDLTRKLLDFSRTKAGNTKRISLNKFVKGMASLIAKSLTPAIALEIAQADDTWAVDVNPGDFEAALLNLALNARDAMPDGGTLVIETANKIIDEHYASRNPGSSTGEFVMVSVSDTGIGMTPDIVAKAIEPFFTTKEIGKGTGLGLSMVYGFVRRSGGHVKIYSEPGQGTTVRLYLPRARGKADRPKSQASNTGSLPRGTETILVVDDEAALLDAAVAILESLGYRTLAATDGLEALEILKGDGSIDLLFSDVIMPKGMDGYRLGIEALKHRPNLRILLTSGFTRLREEFVNGERKVAAELAKDLLPKPYNISELALSVRRVLDRVAMETE